MKYLGFGIMMSTLALSLCACNMNETSDSKMSQAQEKTLDEANSRVGMPAVTNFSEKRILKQIYELRDKQKPTWFYTQALDGRKVCIGQGFGYPIPYATQYSNPQHLTNYDTPHGYQYEMTSQAEPNGLFMPSNAEGTWLLLLNPETGNAEPYYEENRVSASPFKLKGKIVAVDCETEKKKD